MIDEVSIYWTGKSGRKYKYWLFPIGTKFQKEPVNFIFARQLKKGYFTPIYVGETEDFIKHFDGHPKLPCLRRNEATHITVHKGSTSDRPRRAEEMDLINNYNPVCNIKSPFSKLLKNLQDYSNPLEPLD